MPLDALHEDDLRADMDPLYDLGPDTECARCHEVGPEEAMILQDDDLVCPPCAMDGVFGS